MFVTIPACLFESHSLVLLKLSGKLYFDNSLRDANFSLPNLKTLEMTLRDNDLRLLGNTLFMACPMLDSLQLDLFLYEDGHFLNISAPKLKSLKLFIPRKGEDSNFAIDAPNLEHFISGGDLVLFHFVTKPTTLVVADIDLWRDLIGESNNLSHRLLSTFFQQLGSVRSLILSRHSFMVLDYLSKGNENDVVTSIFRNVTHLNLVNIALDEINWSAALPASFISKLKKIDLVFYEVGDNEIKFTEHILSKAVASERLFVSALSCHGAQKLCRALFFPKRRIFNCRIKFSSDCMGASNDGFTSRLLPCQIVCLDVRHIQERLEQMR